MASFEVTAFPQVDEPSPSPKKQKTADLKGLLDGLGQKEATNDDFVAAFLQAGISINKLDHPSIRGLIQKYTKVSVGCNICVLCDAIFAQVFAVEDTEDLCKAINDSQKTKVPVVVSIADTLGALESDLSARVKANKFQPRVEEALKKLPAETRATLQPKLFASRQGNVFLFETIANIFPFCRSVEEVQGILILQKGQHHSLESLARTGSKEFKNNGYCLGDLSGMWLGRLIENSFCFFFKGLVRPEG